MTFLRSLYSLLTLTLFLNFSYAEAVNISYSSDQDIYGFQFDVDGAVVNGASGGDAAGAGFIVSSSATTVIGFSFTGGFIPAGSGVLTTLDVDNASGACLTGLVLSGSGGTTLDSSVIDCLSVAVGDIDEPVLGCTDSSACNYNPDATEDDGSCEAVDCAGYCGGSAIEDECGVCAGDGSSCATQTIDVLYDSESDLYGFQFNLDGASVLGASGGAAADVGFVVS